MCPLSAEQIAGLGFEQVVNAAAVSIVVVDPSGKVIYSNERARALAAGLGHEMPADLDRAIEADLDRPIDIFHPDGRRYEHPEWPAVRSLTSGEEIVEELFYAMPGDERLWIRCYASPVRDPTGEIVAVVLTQTDVSERKREEARLAYHASLLENVEDGVIATDAEHFRVTAWNTGAERLYGFSAEEVLGRSARQIASFPGDEARLKLERELLETGRTRIEFTARRKDGSSVEVELIAVAVKDDHGQTAGYLGIHRDISDRKRAQEQLERRAVQQAAVAELGLRALEHLGLRSLMDEAVALVCRTLGVEYAKVDELLPGGEGLLVCAGTGWRDGVVGNCVMPTGRGSPAGYALLAGEPVIVEDMTADTPFEVPSVLRDHGVMSDITVAIVPSGEPFGTLVAASTERRTFSEDDVSFVQSVANVLATAIEHAKSEERLQSAQEAERSRIARAMHDEALQSLSDAIALAAMADRATAESRLAGQLLSVLRRAGEQLRSAIYDLRLQSEEHTPFVELLERLVDEHRAMLGDGEIELEVGEGIPAGSLGVEGIEVLRIVGEALTNARRHADAQHVRVRVWGTKNGLRAEVSDDGRGFDPTAPRSPRHHGLTGMRERAQQMGGRLEIDRTPGIGTTVRLEVILPNGSSGPS